MTRTMHAVLVIGLAFVGLGCGPSVWERSFEFESGVSGAAPTAGVVVREAPWGRVGPALEAERERIIASDTHREDWAPDRARENEIEVLAALQLPIDPANARLLGRSHFKTTQPVAPEAGELAAFGAGLGADYAIWASQPLGKAETIEHEAVTRDRWRWDRIWDADRGRFLYVRRWDPETVWVPLVIERDEVRWVVFYVRRESSPSSSIREQRAADPVERE
jgi:hypothetical protein